MAPQPNTKFLMYVQFKLLTATEFHFIVDSIQDLTLSLGSLQTLKDCSYFPLFSKYSAILQT